MKSFSIQSSVKNLESDLSKVPAAEMDVIIIFTSRSLLEDNEIHKKVQALVPGVQIAGCSTSGEIGDRVDDDSISLMGLKLDTGRIKCVSTNVLSPEHSQTVGRKIADMMEADDLAGLFVLSPGLTVNGSRLIKGIKDHLPAHISVSGGLAGDGLGFKKTVTLFNGELSENAVITIGLYGKNVKVSCGSKGGWKPFGPLRRVTKSVNNELFELDGKPALDLYKEYLGEKAKDLPASGLLYPFAIMNEDSDSSIGLIRTILNIDEDKKSLIMAGDIDVGQLVCLMHANSDELIAGAADAASKALNSEERAEDSAVICVSCVGRKILMGDNTEDELDAVKAVFQGGHVSGFYSYGELGFSDYTDEAELHNQTMTITYITENSA